jgi:broad specificity phosphatase PhoE
MSSNSQNVANAVDLSEFIRARGPNCLILARHGETAWNAEGRLQGQQDIPLNSRGHSQAMIAARILKSIPIKQVYASSLQRCQQTAKLIADVNIQQPNVASSDLLKETALGILEGELKDHQSTAELSRHYRNFSSDEIDYRIPDGENLHDVTARVRLFFAEHGQSLRGPERYLIVGHRNLNKMILKHLLGLSYAEGFRVEQEHQRLYLYFEAARELWSCWLAESSISLTEGYVTSTVKSYA